MSPLDLTLIAVLATIASLPQNVAGFGFALVLAPLLVLFIDAQDTVIIVNILAMLSAAAIVWRLREHIAWRTAGTLFAASFVGMPLGLIVLLVVDARVLQILIALAVLSGTLALARGFTIGAGTPIAAAQAPPGASCEPAPALPDRPSSSTSRAAAFPPTPSARPAPSS